MFHRLILLAVAATICANTQLSHAQQIAVAPQFAGTVTQIPVVVSNAAANDPYAIVATGAPVSGSPFAWIGNGPLLGSNQQPSVGRFWLRLEYLNLWTDGMNVPALVTTSPEGTPRDTAAVLGEDGTTILFGGQEINSGSVGGFQASAGFWTNPQRTFAVESEYFQLAKQKDGFSANGNGSPILGRPFFDIVAGQQTAQLISFPDLVSGNISINSSSDLRSFLLNGRLAIVPTNGLGHTNCDPQDRTDWIFGYRRLVLNDNLGINQNLESASIAAPGTLVMNESFASQNKFDGLQLGVVNVKHFRRAWLESTMRVALGNNRQNVQINGSTAITEAGITDTFTGGLLAQRTNIGSYQRKQFTMVPEIGLKLGVRLTDRAYATIGYTVLYFPNVVRAGEQIDTDVNPGLTPPESVPLTGALRPRFRYIESDYLANGISLGGEFRF